MSIRVSVVLLCAGLACPSWLWAQSQCISNPAPCSTPVGALPITINIPAIFDLQLQPGATTLATPTTAVFTAGFAATDGPVATIRSNAPWALSISALSATWSAVTTGAEAPRADKPASDLAWSTSASGAFTDLTVTPIQVATGLPTLRTSLSLFYRTRYQWALDAPGNYSLQILFTIAAP